MTSYGEVFLEVHEAFGSLGSLGVFLHRSKALGQILGREAVGVSVGSKATSAVVQAAHHRAFSGRGMRYGSHSVP